MGEEQGAKPEQKREAQPGPGKIMGFLVTKQLTDGPSQVGTEFCSSPHSFTVSVFSSSTPSHAHERASPPNMCVQ